MTASLEGHVPLDGWLASRGWGALALVDPRCRMLCALIAVEGRSYDEVSRATGLPIGSIGPLYMRAKQKLRKALEN